MSDFSFKFGASEKSNILKFRGRREEALKRDNFHAIWAWFKYDTSLSGVV